MAVRAVTLDAAGTLIGVAEPVGETYARVAARHGIVVRPDDAEAGFRAALAGAAPLAFPGASPARLGDHERAWWYTIVRRALGPAAAGAPVDATFDELFAYYGTAAAWHVFPDVPPALDALRRHGVRIAAVSNFDGRLGPLLDALGLATALDAVVCSGRAGSAKPHPAIFLAAIRQLAVAPTDAVHVGDAPVEDVQGARAAGLRAVLVDREGGAAAVPADVPVLPTLSPLPRLLAEW